MPLPKASEALNHGLASKKGESTTTNWHGYKRSTIKVHAYELSTLVAKRADARFGLFRYIGIALTSRNATIVCGHSRNARCCIVGHVACSSGVNGSHGCADSFALASRSVEVDAVAHSHARTHLNADVKMSPFYL